MKTISLLVLCGGKSAEHEISLLSTWYLLHTLQDANFNLQLICIDKLGNWYEQNISEFLNQEANPKTITIQDKSQPLLIKPGNGENKIYNIKTQRFLPDFDVIFPLLHGPNGEDGSIQGVLKHIQKPFIGSGVLGSAICMDKDIAKQLFKQNNIPTSRFKVVRKGNEINFKSIIDSLGLPLFVKPANLGSSVGIQKTNDESELINAIKNAFKYDEKVIIEEFIDGQEVECAILGNQDLIASVPGTYIHSDEFFDYDTKYLKTEEVVIQIPASILSKKQQKEVMDLAKKSYLCLQCTGFARVDTFVTKDGRYLVNEINTIPGFTKNSMYTKLMESYGITYANLVKQMCELAIECIKS